MKLYDYPPSGNGYKVRLALAALTIPYEYIPLDILAGQTRTPEFLAKNPNGRIPLLQLPDESYLAESNAILFYLAQGSDLWPKTALDQAKVLQWMFFEQYSHEPKCRHGQILDLNKEDLAEGPRIRSSRAQDKARLRRTFRHGGSP